MKIGFIGVGGIAGNYLDSLKKLNQNVAAVCDVNRERAGQVAEEWNAKAYDDHRAMLENEGLDVVFVAIPPGAHTTQVADVARAGAALFVAKPIALEAQTVRESLAAICESGVINQAGYMARYSDITEKAQQIAQGRELFLGTGRFMCRMGSHPWWGKKALSGGQMLEQSTHVFDWLRLFLGEVTQVQAFGHSGATTDYTDFEDSTVCNLRFENGAVATITSTCAANVPDGFSAELIGRDFYLKALMDHQLMGVIDGEKFEYSGQEAGYYRQVEKFLEAAYSKDQSSIRSSYADAAKSFAVTLAANASLESGQAEVVEVLA